MLIVHKTLYHVCATVMSYTHGACTYRYVWSICHFKYLL